jgi:Glycosyltransferase 61
VIIQHRTVSRGGDDDDDDDDDDENTKLGYFEADWRRWKDHHAALIYRNFRMLFPDHEVFIVRDDDPDWRDCFACQVRAYANTEVLVGIHGAGLTNVMFLPPGAILVEIAGTFDGRTVPVCGYFGPTAGELTTSMLLMCYSYSCVYCILS